jgi:hypothetical protein
MILAPNYFRRPLIRMFKDLVIKKVQPNPFSEYRRVGKDLLDRKTKTS